MSAIAGILYFRGEPASAAAMQKLTLAMRSRGPDEQTQWVHGAVALGHCMLRTTPESTEERQPLQSPDGNLVMVWDGRLDNREQLKRDLIAEGARLRDNSDAELALHGYAVWGGKCPERLLGDFAFAVWDERLGKLFCARDHMGARPFYYTNTEHFFAFASEDEALLSLPDVPNQPNEELIASLLVPGFMNEDGASTWLEKIRTLPPASCMDISSEGVMLIKTYWQLEPGPEAEYGSEEECWEAFLEVFAEAVRCRMRTNGHVTAMMSGGMDSASIAVMAKRLAAEMPGRQFHTYSAVSDRPEACIETRCIQSLTGDLGANAHFISVPSFTGMVEVEDLIETGWSKAHPVDNSILLPTLMCLAANRDGHRVMLHGMGGDLAMYAPERYIAYLLRAGHWRDAWRECRMASRHHTFLWGYSPYFLMRQNIWSAYAPQSAQRLARRIRNVRDPSPLAHSLINRDFAKRIGLVPRMSARRVKEKQKLPSLQEGHIQHSLSPFGFVLGLTGYERVAGRYGIEFRDPWSDRRLVEFWVRLPLKYKVRNGWTKYLVRSGFEQELEPHVRWRSGKENLGWDFVCRLMDETDGFVSNTLESGLKTLENYVEPKLVLERYAEYCGSNGRLGRKEIFDLTTLIIWLNRIAGR